MAIGTPVAITGFQTGIVSGAGMVTNTDAARGSLIVVLVQTNSFQQTITGVTDSAGNTYLQAVGKSGQLGAPGSAIYYCSASPNDLPASSEIFVTTSSGQWNGAAFSVSGANGGLDILVSKSGNGNSASLATGAFATNSEIAFTISSMGGAIGGFTEGAGFTQLYEQGATNPCVDLAYVDVNATTTKTYSPAWSNFNPYTLCIASFKSSTNALVAALAGAATLAAHTVGPQPFSAAIAGGGAVQVSGFVGTYNMRAALAGVGHAYGTITGEVVPFTTYLPIYPDRSLLPGLAFSEKWSPTFYNAKTVTTATGAEIDLGLAQYPLHDFELTYEFLRDGPLWNGSAEFKTLMGFHLQLGGTLGRFFFKNIDDYQADGNIVGAGDGATNTFTLLRTFGANGHYGSEPVGIVDTTQFFNVYLDGGLVSPATYSIDTSNPAANTITFASPPGLGVEITVDMSYYYYCKLAVNSNTFEKFMTSIWNLGKVTLHSCRAGA